MFIFSAGDTIYQLNFWQIRQVASAKHPRYRMFCLRFFFHRAGMRFSSLKMGRNSVKKKRQI